MPSRTSPQSSRPCESAPTRVAAESACFGVTTDGSPVEPLYSSASRYRSCIMSWLLFEAMPSVPRHTLTPRSSMAGMGA